MADFDPLTVPAVMPDSVRRTTDRLINGKTVPGFPAQALLDYEQALQAWMKSNVANTNTRLNLVSEEVDGAYAAVATEANARATADEALAEDITTVSAAVGTVSASGQIYFAAKAAPGGSSAAYGLYLTAGSAFAGFEALALSAGGSAIGLTANQFMFTDSGTATAILTYSGGLWTFNSNVSINGNLVVNGTIVTDKIASNAVTQSAWATGSTNPLSVAVTARAGAVLQIRGSNDGGDGTLVLTLSGVSTLKSITTVPYVTGTNPDGSPSGFAYPPIFIDYVYGPVSAGTYTFELLGTTPGGATDRTLVVTELVR